jgi:hypothetical protein
LRKAALMNSRLLFGSLGFFGFVLSIVACSSGAHGTGTSGTSGSSGQDTSTDPTYGSTNVSSLVEQVNGGCSSSPQKLKGHAPAGSSCTTYADCKPSCCGCSTSGSFLTAACVDGTCASTAVACGHSQKSACGETSGSSGTSGTSGSSGGNKGRCVAGESYDCQYTANGTWTGTTCCVDTSLTCVAGESYDCQYTAHGKWTGSLCCVPAVTHCEAGSSYDCQYTAHGKWTGSLCCL